MHLDLNNMFTAITMYLWQRIKPSEEMSLLNAFLFIFSLITALIQDIALIMCFI